MGNDDVHPEADKVSRELRESRECPVGKSVLEHDASPFAIAQLPQTFLQGLE